MPSSQIRDEADGHRAAEATVTKRARRNALADGLEGLELLPGQFAGAVEARMGEWNSTMKPFNPWEMWLLERMAVESLRVERGTIEEEAMRAGEATRAELCWDDDRRLAAIELAAGLADRPDEVRLRLGRTPQGCRWLVDRWRDLQRAVGHFGGWDGPRRDLALDLLGVPTASRFGDLAVDLPPEGQLALAEAEIEGLERRAGRLAGAEDAGRDLAEAGLGAEVAACQALRQVRRHENAGKRRLEWLFGQFKKARHAYHPIPEVPPWRRHAPEFDREPADPDRRETWPSLAPTASAVPPWPLPVPIAEPVIEPEPDPEPDAQPGPDRPCPRPTPGATAPTTPATPIPGRDARLVESPGRFRTGPACPAPGGSPRTGRRAAGCGSRPG